MVEFYAHNANDPGDYMIGEGLQGQRHAAPGSAALRYMFKPSLDGVSPDCYRATLGILNVHYSSGVANHFYYLLARRRGGAGGFRLRHGRPT